jgi:hypothetical protein
VSLELSEIAVKRRNYNVVWREKFQPLSFSGTIWRRRPYHPSSATHIMIITDVASGSWRIPMRGFASYVMASILVVLALDFVAPPVGLGLAIASGPGVDQSQTVVRSHKGDRLSVPAASGKTPSKSPTVLVGCDPAFSPLSASAQANFSARCIA